MLRRLTAINPLWLIAIVFAIQVLVVPFTVSLGTLALVVVLAYLQNATYGLQSRSANRNSNLYHLIAAVAANFTFFWSLRLLVRNELPAVLLAPYVLATILGSLHGNTISMKIESALGLSADGAKGRPQFLKLWPTIAALLVVLVVQILWLAPSYGRGVLVAILILTILDSFTFSLLRVARSMDSYWFHALAVTLQIGLAFIKLAIMIKHGYDWALFMPTATGSVIGSLIGANLGQDIGKKIGARFDAHTLKDAQVSLPVFQLAPLGLVLVAQTLVFGAASWKVGGMMLLLFSAWQSVSFTMVSRARQRGNAQYLAWTSVFSNGVWYLTMHQLTLGSITAEKAIPYIVGATAGSLIGQLISMKVEQATGAVMDQAPQAKPVVA